MDEVPVTGDRSTVGVAAETATGVHRFEPSAALAKQETLGGALFALLATSAILYAKGERNWLVLLGFALAASLGPEVSVSADGVTAAIIGGIAAGVTVSITALACVGPARRALRIQPIISPCRQQDSGRDAHCPLMPEKVCIGTAVIIRVLMNIDDRFRAGRNVVSFLNRFASQSKRDSRAQEFSSGETVRCHSANRRLIQGAPVTLQLFHCFQQRIEPHRFHQVRIRSEIIGAVDILFVLG